MTNDAKWSDFASMDSAKTLAAANRLLPAWIILLLVVAIAWQLAGIAWMLVSGASTGDTVTVPANQLAAQATTSGATNTQAIANTHIFGAATGSGDGSLQPIPEEISNLRDTRLVNLTLKGTVASDPTEMAIAIIADGANEEKIYTIGANVTNGAILHAVYTDRVVLNENGVLTNLKLPKDFPVSTIQATRRNTTTTSRAGRNTQSIRSLVTQNVSKLADVIRPTPYFVNGQQQGYRVYPGRNRAQFVALGLRPGDLIKDIDGQALTDPTQAMKIFQSLDTADQVAVTVERNGQPHVVVLNTSQLDLRDKTNK
jgi:general secretion pathway protein C